MLGINNEMLGINNEFILESFKLFHKNDIMSSNYVYLWLKLLLYLFIITWIQSTFSMILSLLKKLSIKKNLEHICPHTHIIISYITTSSQLTGLMMVIYAYFNTMLILILENAKMYYNEQKIIILLS